MEVNDETLPIQLDPPLSIPLDLPATGVFHTGDLGRSKLPIRWDMRRHTKKAIRSDSPYTTPPTIPVAVMWIEIGNSKNVQVKCKSTKITDTKFSIDILTRLRMELRQVSCAWLGIGPTYNRDSQSGSFNTGKHRPQAPNPTKRVHFSRRYAAPPTVVVWLSRINIASDRR